MLAGLFAGGAHGECTALDLCHLERHATHGEGLCQYFFFGHFGREFAQHDVDNHVHIAHINLVVAVDIGLARITAGLCLA